MSPPRGVVTIADARDAFECCGGVAGDRARGECYTTFGADADRVERFLGTVEHLEEDLALASGDVTTVLRLGPVRVVIDSAWWSRVRLGLGF
jgi:hypothetical protein